MSYSLRTLFCAGLMIAGLSATGFAQQNPYRFNPEHRRPVETTLHDLESIGTRAAYTHRDRDRYEHAIEHLQQFADRLHQGGYFDRGKLDQSIGDLQNVLDHNPMPPPAHEELTRDLFNLRRLRQEFRDGRRY